MQNNHINPTIPSGHVTRILIVANAIALIAYFAWWFNPNHIGQPVLFGLLFFGEVYHVLMAFLFWRTVWPKKPLTIKTSVNNKPTVDVYITVCGEPIEIVRDTAIAAKNMDYPKHKVFILNDSRVANKDNWQEYEDLAKEIGITCITRTIPGGAKAGNINNALRQTKGSLITIFDADMIPHKDFLQKTVPYFADDHTGFVQSPQYYKNYDENEITGGAWDQQKLFFGPIMKGKEADNSAFICGTNVVIRRKAIVQAGGMCEDNIAEDFITSYLIHSKGWKSVYVSEVLAQGLAPEDLLSYFKQQLRWARGSLEVLFKYNPLFKKGLTFAQKMQYLSSALYYFNGLIVLIDMAMPLVFLFTGLEPVKGTTTQFAFFFLPFMAFTLYTLYVSSGRSITLRAISFSISSWTLQLIALWSIITNKKMGFAVTPKHAQQGNFLHLAYPHIAYIILCIIAGIYSYNRIGLSPSFITNMAWCVFNISMFIPFIMASYPWSNLPSNIMKSITSKTRITQTEDIAESTIQSIH